MTNETKPVLLTEAEFLEKMKDWCYPNQRQQVLNELRERGLIAPEPVDPLMIEAREICAKWGRQDYPGFNHLALAALKRGIELGEAKNADH